MSHQPFESWLFSDQALDEEQQYLLHEHLEECQQCRAISESWSQVQSIMVLNATPEPAPGFTDRWHNRLVLIRQKRQRRRMWLLSFGMLGLAGLIFLGLATTSLLSTSLPYALSQFIASFAVFAARINQVWNVFESLSGAFPLLIPLIIFAFIGSGSAGVALIITWLSSVIKLYKPAEEGVVVR
jgi:predicted anti-sigma-YlaC factor YlaD